MAKLKKTVMVQRLVGWIKKSQKADIKKTMRRKNLQGQVERLRQSGTQRKNAPAPKSKPLLLASVTAPSQAVLPVAPVKGKQAGWSRKKKLIAAGSGVGVAGAAGLYGVRRKRSK